VVAAASDGPRHGERAVGAGLRVLRCPLVPAASQPGSTSGGLARRMRNVSFAVASAPTLLAEAASFRPDIVGALTPSTTAASAALAAARLASCPAWLHLEEDAPSLGIEPAFALVSAAAFDAAQRLERRSVAAQCALALAPWVDTAAICPLDQPSLIRDIIALEAHDVIALHVGEMSDERVALALIDAARRVPPQGAIHFVVAARGPALGPLAEAARSVQRLRLLPMPPARDLNLLLAAADIHLMPDGIDAADAALPAKLATLLASGRPIVCARPPFALPSALADAVVPAPATGDGIADAVVRLAASASARQAAGQAARRAAQDYFAKERVLRVLERRLMALAGR
jgi:colanic acid biosynthesis glycosyl transferase WcaI